MVQFPFAATHFNQQNQLQQMELVMDDQLDACIDYISNPCDMTSATRLADVTYDSVHPTCSITKVSERFGEPDNNTKIRRRLMEATGSQQLYILMLFNFSKPSEFILPIKSLINIDNKKFPFFLLENTKEAVCFGSQDESVPALGQHVLFQEGGARAPQVNMAEAPIAEFSKPFCASVAFCVGIARRMQTGQ